MSSKIISKLEVINKIKKNGTLHQKIVQGCLGAVREIGLSHPKRFRRTMELISQSKLGALMAAHARRSLSHCISPHDDFPNGQLPM
jgi:hypothetical protein